ncbi:MAG TPA: DUF2157 domain-containing protein [Candidatus Paceibacterota bacterium]|nr:DUF2157 domain-containing protein [Verrucomicrobiota bacterium]HRY49066.1 DUF2157 domain-containing protein [Candidatus Paceibacterota bacterium]HRZ99156.1 DUF2157 domain-containing protein [Candidatus Paceibacterota bacterium]
MKHADIQRLLEDGLISQQQHDLIAERYGLKESANRVLVVFSMIGAVLVVAGIILIIGSNWEEIPRAIKVAGGLFLMLGAYGGGYYLRDVRREHTVIGEMLYFLGAGLFLANIALIGQIYNLSSRSPNGILLWWIGIAGLPWVLRSLALHVASLIAFLLLLGCETFMGRGRLFFCGDQRIVAVWAVIGLAVYSLGTVLHRTSYRKFSKVTEVIGLLIFNAMSLPLIYKWFYHSYAWRNPPAMPGALAYLGICALTLILALWGLEKREGLDKTWRYVWGATLGGAVLMTIGAVWLSPIVAFENYYHAHSPAYNSSYWMFATVVLFVFAILQIQVGIKVSSSGYVNLAMVMIALIIISAYITLIGSMARTGLTFVAGGVLLIGTGIFLEKRRRVLLGTLRSSMPQEAK